MNTSSELFKNTYTEEVYSIAAPVTVIIGVPWSHLKEDQLQLLSKILIAIGKSLEGVKVLEQESFDISSWVEKPSRIIAFIAPPKGLSSYEAVPAGESTVVFSDPLSTLINDDAAKRKLWGTLKAVFQS